MTEVENLIDELVKYLSLEVKAYGDQKEWEEELKQTLRRMYDKGYYVGHNRNKYIK